MKPIRFANIFASALVLSMAAATAGTPTPATPAAAPAPAANWVTLTMGGAFVSGDDANMMRRTATNGDFWGGIGDFHYGRSLANETSLTIDGHAIPGLEDYEFGMLLNKEGLGYLKVSYDQFRTWYDASGGYTALAPSQYMVPFSDERSVDRGEFSFEAGLRMENMPEVTFRYVHSFRDGDKDSTCWGDAYVAAGTPYKTVPALWFIDETTDTLELDVAHTLGNTDLEGGLVWEHSEIDNSRYTPRWGTTAPAGATGVNQVRLNERNDSDLFAGHIASVTRFNDNAWLSFAASYSGMDSDIDGGSRSYQNYWPTPIPGAPAPTRRDYAYDQMTGGSKVNQFIANLNFMWVPMPDLTVTPSLRYENETIFTVSQFRAFNSNQTWLGTQALTSDSDMDEMSEGLDIRYKGIDNLVLYATADWTQEEESVRRLDNMLPGEWLNTNIDVDDQEYALGANWYPMSNLSFSAEWAFGQRDQSFDHVASSENKANNDPKSGGANNLRPVMDEHNTETNDLNLRATWRPMSNLSLVTRYDYVKTDFENRGLNLSPAGTAPTTAVPFAMIGSGTVESNILSESVTWTPMARMYVQGTMSWVWSETTTPMALTTPNVDNDYITCGLTCGYALDDRSDLTFGYTYYGANNYSMATNSLGYGLETSEHMVNLTYSRMIADNMMWNLSYGFITSNTDGVDQSGGYDDFDAHLISTGLQIRF